MDHLFTVIKRLVVISALASLASCLSGSDSSSSSSSASSAGTSSASYQAAYDACFIGTPALYSSTYCAAYANSIAAGNSASTANIAGATAAHSNVGNIGTGQTIDSVGTPLTNSGTGGGSTGGGTTTGTLTASCTVGSGLTKICTQYGSLNSTGTSALATSCSINGGTYSTYCPSGNVGRCLLGNSSNTYAYYYDTTASVASYSSACTQAGGTWY